MSVLRTGLHDIGMFKDNLRLVNEESFVTGDGAGPMNIVNGWWYTCLACASPYLTTGLVCSGESSMCEVR